MSLYYLQYYQAQERERLERSLAPYKALVAEFAEPTWAEKKIAEAEKIIAEADKFNAELEKYNRKRQKLLKEDTE